MEYNNKEIFNTARKIVADMQDLKEESITEDACSFCWDLDFDSLDQYEFLLPDWYSSHKCYTSFSIH